MSAPRRTKDCLLYHRICDLPCYRRNPVLEAFSTSPAFRLIEDINSETTDYLKEKVEGAVSKGCLWDIGIGPLADIVATSMSAAFFAGHIGQNLFGTDARLDARENCYDVTFNSDQVPALSLGEECRQARIVASTPELFAANSQCDRMSADVGSEYRLRPQLSSPVVRPSGGLQPGSETAKMQKDLEFLLFTILLSIILTNPNNSLVQLTAQNTMEDAEKLLRWTVMSMENELEEDNPLTMRSVCGLALILTESSKHDEAEVTYRKALKLSNKVLGWDDPETLKTLGHLQLSLSKHGRFMEAAEVAQTYCLPAEIKSIGLDTFHLESSHLSVGLIDDHHDDSDIEDFFKSVDGFCADHQDDFLAVELMLDLRDLRIVVIVSLCALMGSRLDLIKAIKGCLERAKRISRKPSVDIYVCCIGRNRNGSTWTLPPNEGM